MKNLGVKPASSDDVQMYGYPGSPAVSIVVTTSSSITGLANTWYRANPTTAAITVSLPAAPPDGTLVIVENTGTTNANTVSFIRSGTDTIEGSTSAVVLNPPEVAELTYYAATGQWMQRRMLVSSTPGTVMRRDNLGRSQVAAPSANLDIANKAYVDGKTPVIGEYLAPVGSLQMASNIQSLASGALTSGLAAFYPVDIPVASTYSSLVASVTTAQVAGTGTLVKGAVYSDNGTGGAPLLTAAGLLGQATFTVTSTGIKTQALASAITLQPGRYWVCGFYYQGSTAPTTAPALICCNVATILWSSASSFLGTRYLSITGLTDLPQSNNTVAPNSGSTGIVVGLLRSA